MVEGAQNRPHGRVRQGRDHLQSDAARSAFWAVDEQAVETPLQSMSFKDSTWGVTTSEAQVQAQQCDQLRLAGLSLRESVCRFTQHGSGIQRWRPASHLRHRSA